MSTVKKIACLASALLFVGGSSIAFGQRVVADEGTETTYVTQKQLLNGDTYYATHNVYVDYSGSTTKLERSVDYSMAAARSFKSTISTESRAVGRVHAVPAADAIYLDDMNQENLMFSFWLYSTDEVTLTDSSAVYFGKGDGAKNSLKITPQSGIFSKENRVVEKGWNLFTIDLGAILSGDSSKGEIVLYGTSYETDYNNGVLGINKAIERVDVVAIAESGSAEWYIDDFKFYDREAGFTQDVSNPQALQYIIDETDIKTCRFNYTLTFEESVYITRDIAIDFNGYRADGREKEGIFAVKKNVNVKFTDAYFRRAWNAVHLFDDATATFVGETKFTRMSQAAIVNNGAVDFSDATVEFDSVRDTTKNYLVEFPANAVKEDEVAVAMISSSASDYVPDGYTEVEIDGKYYLYLQ